MRLAFDIETDGFIANVTKVHCINVIDVDTGEEYRFNTDLDNIKEGLRLLSIADEITAHYGLGYDVPVLKHLYPTWKPLGLKRDSKVEAAVIWTNVKDMDFARKRRGICDIPGNLVGTHKLAAWGWRLGDDMHKGDFNPKDYGHTWATIPFSKDMDDYCMQDVRTLVGLIKKIDAKNYSEECLQLERDVQSIIYRQEQHGWLFNETAAEKLVADMQIRKIELEEECRTVFPPFYLRAQRKPFIPKRDNAKMGYVANAPCMKVKLVDFNPGSRDHIANRLKQVHGWSPQEYTPEGKAKVDETVLEALPYPEAKKLAEYFKTTKRLGMLAEGKNAWLRLVRDGRIYGRVNTNGAVTGRMSHYAPNVAQADKHPPMRSLFIVPAGRKLVGCDADGLELRILAHYMSKFDGGAYVDTVTKGSKENGDDAHTLNKIALGMNKRDTAKTWFYAFIYGAGNYKLGTLVYDDFTDEKRDRFNAKYPAGKKRDGALARLGRSSRGKLMSKFPALKTLIEKVQDAAKRGHLIGLDGRRIHVRSAYCALNTLLQSGGAVVMKKALVILDQNLQQSKVFVPGRDYEFVANVHDEWQIETGEQHADKIGMLAADSIRAAGEHYNLRCPLAGDFAVGDNWSQTH